jgi:hypothetical protein
VTVPGIAEVHGGGGLEAFTDVSSRIAVEMLNAEHDASTGTITAILRLRNRSDATIHGPFKLRALSMRSEIGKVAAANADNDMAGLAPQAPSEMAGSIPTRRVPRRR